MDGQTARRGLTRREDCLPGAARAPSRQGAPRRLSWRRGVVAALLTITAGFSAPASSEGVVAHAELGKPEPFTFESVIDTAEHLATAPFQPPAAESVLDTLDGRIGMRDSARLWADQPDGFRIRGLHRSRFRRPAVRVHEVDGDEARPWIYRKSAFDYEDPGAAREASPDLGFGGIEIQRPALSGGEEGAEPVLIRLSGEGFIYQPADGPVHGVSARLLLAEQGVDTEAGSTPFFRALWLERPDPADTTLVIYAQLDAPGLTAAARLVLDAAKTESPALDVDLRVFVRHDLAVLGVAALGSHFWYGENDRRAATDWRPEVHGSDGLLMQTGSGARLWRPLVNPPHPDDSRFRDVDPEGFGLLQRDRDFASYQDTETPYHTLPDLWVAPESPWGEGSVILREIPTKSADIDNVLAFWNPRPPADAGTRWRFEFRMGFGRQVVPDAELLEVSATRLGLARYAGEPRDDGSLRLVIDLEPPAGGDQASRNMAPEAHLSTTRGTAEVVDLSRVVGSDQWRLMIDLAVSGREPVDLRAQLVEDDLPVSETWLYRLHPGALSWLEQ
ncbi:MAG: glucan biosynthesis protein [Halothiobacillaceae bacterium]